MIVIYMRPLPSLPDGWSHGWTLDELEKYLRSALHGVGLDELRAVRVVEEPRRDRPRFRALLADPTVTVIAAERPEQLLHDHPHPEQVLDRVRFVGWGGEPDTSTELGRQALLLLIQAEAIRMRALDLLHLQRVENNPERAAARAARAAARRPTEAREVTELTAGEWATFEALTAELDDLPGPDEQPDEQ